MAGDSIEHNHIEAMNSKSDGYEDDVSDFFQPFLYSLAMLTRFVIL
jgi:hypothetical protein